MMIPVSIMEKPMKETKLILSLKMKYPAMIVSTKLIPVETGIIKVKSPSDKALNITRAEIKIRPNAAIT